VKNIPEVFWPDHGDLPYIRLEWAKRNYKTFYTGNQTTPFKFDCNIKNFRRLFLRQVFTPWHDGNNTCTIEEYCLQNSKSCINYKKNIRETNDIEEIISHYQEGHEPYLFCKLYDEKQYYVYPEVIKKYIEAGFTKGIEDIEELPILISNSEEESREALVQKIQKLNNLLVSNKERLEEVQKQRDECNNRNNAYEDINRLNSVIKKLNIDEEEMRYTLNCSNNLFIKKSEKKMYVAYSIVYSKSKKRLNNYYKCKKIIPELTYTEAVDSITDYEYYKNYALQNGILTGKYIESNSYYKGKIGCNLSHMYILYDFINNKNLEWALVLEDDVQLCGYDKGVINRLIEKANDNDSHYIQLCTYNERFLEEQKSKEQIDENLYSMTPQWWATAYLISKTGAKRIVETYPLDQNIDGVYSKNISRLRSLCYLNQIFINKGDADTTKKGEFGSIIWGTEVNENV
jgi:hypothetical protein